MLTQLKEKGFGRDAASFANRLMGIKNDTSVVITLIYAQLNPTMGHLFLLGVELHHGYSTYAQKYLVMVNGLKRHAQDSVQGIPRNRSKDCNIRS